MATNNFSVFAENSENILTPNDYTNNEQRINGVQSGLASSAVQNTSLKQVSAMTKALADLMVAKGQDADYTQPSELSANLQATLEPLVLTFTRGSMNSDGITYGGTMDKTFAEAYAARQSGREVAATYSNINFTLAAYTGSQMRFVAFYTGNNNPPNAYGRVSMIIFTSNETCIYSDNRINYQDSTASFDTVNLAVDPYMDNQAATKWYVDATPSRAVLKLNAAPTTSTVGFVGQLASVNDSELWACADIENGKYIWHKMALLQKSLITDIITESTTWRVPASVNEVQVRLFGGGGGGGSAAYSTSGGGGGGGGYMAYDVIEVTPNEDITVTIGAGGAARQAGGITSFGAYLSAEGGSKGGTTNNETGGNGGDGGSGGGGGSGYDAGGIGGNGAYGGGGGGGSGKGGNGGNGGTYGGGGGGGSMSSSNAGNGGNGGTYGGGGGNGYSNKNDTVPGTGGEYGGDGGTYNSAAQNGTNTTAMDLEFTGTGLAGTYGTYASGGGGGYGGNGGGYVTIGGTSLYGGGGGGGYGGNGGSPQNGGGGGGGYGANGGNGEGGGLTGYGGGGGGGGYGGGNGRNPSAYSGEHGTGGGGGGGYGTANYGSGGNGLSTSGGEAVSAKAGLSGVAILSYYVWQVI